MLLLHQIVLYASEKVFRKTLKSNNGNWWEDQKWKLRYDINRETTKVSALSFGKTEKYKCLTSEEIKSSNRRPIIKQAKFACYPLGGKKWKNRLVH